MKGTTITIGTGEKDIKNPPRGRPSKVETEGQVEEAVNLAQEIKDRIEEVPTKLPKNVKPKDFERMSRSVIDTQNTVIQSALRLLQEKDAFLREWELWMASVREATNTILEAREVIRQLDSEKTSKYEKQLAEAKTEVNSLNNQVTELKQRVKMLLGQ